MNSNWSYAAETAKWGPDLCDLDLWSWSLTWTSRLSMVINPENFMMIQWEEHSEKGVTDGHPERSVLRAAWSQLISPSFGVNLTTSSCNTPVAYAYQRHECMKKDYIFISYFTLIWTILIYFEDFSHELRPVYDLVKKSSAYTRKSIPSEHNAAKITSLWRQNVLMTS